MHNLSFYCHKYEKYILVFIFLFSTLQILKLLPYQLDDAYITYHYAQNFISNGIFSFNLNQENTEGFTSFFWFLSSSLLGFISIKAIHLTGPILGYISYCLCFILAVFSSSKSTDKIIKTLLLAFLPTLLFYAVTGLETVLFALLIVTICLGISEHLPQKITLAACLIVPWVRPEAPWLAMVFIAYFLQAKDKRSTFKKLLPYALTLLLSQLLLLVTRFYIFSDILPNTYYEKEADIYSGFSYLLAALQTPWVALIIVSAVVLTYFSKQRFFIVFAFIWLLTPLLTGGDWMSYYRFLLPALLLFIFSINTENTHDKKFTTAVILAVALMLSGYFFSAGKAFNNATITSKNFLAMMDKEDTWLQGWLNNQNIQSVAAIDIGKLAFNNNFEVLDLGGLTDKTLAKLPGKHMEKSIPITYFLKRNPDAVLIRLSSRPTNSQLKHTDIMSPTESDLALHPLLHQHYQVVFAMGPSYLRTPFYGQLVFIRKDLKAAISSSKDMPLDYSEGIPFISLQASEASFVK